MRTAAAALDTIWLGITLLTVGCGRSPDQTEIATTARSWTQSTAVAASLWRDGAVPTSFARHTVETASDALTTARTQAAQLPNTANVSQLARGVDSAQRLLPVLDSMLAHSRRDSAAQSIARLHAIAAVLSPLAAQDDVP